MSPVPVNKNRVSANQKAVSDPLKTVVFNNKSISFTDQGRGRTLVLLHGFTESGKIWKEFSKKLCNDFRVIVIDLPGHGKSDGVADVHTMELQAEVVHHVLEARKIRECIMVGHSMGGYVTLAFAAKHPEMLRGFCLFHSHSFPDTTQDKEIRDRTIRLVQENKLSFITQFIPGLFPVEAREKYEKEIGQLIRRAGKMQKENIIAALEGMKERYDQCHILKTTSLPVLFILGLKDGKAPQARLWEMISMPANSESLILRDSGHMGYIEEPVRTLEAIRSFAKKTFAHS
jgi:pimeloyl-ACP methyl ester carboxylesterase